MSLAKLMFQSASRAISEFNPGEKLAQSIRSGSQLALARERLGMQQQQLEQQQNMVAAKRDGMWFDKITKASKLENVKMRNLIYDRIEREAEQAGNPFDPSFVQGLKASTASVEAVSAAQTTYQQEWQKSVNQGRPTDGLNAARAELSDMMYGGNLEPLVKAEQQFEREQLKQEGQALRQQTKIQADISEEERKLEQLPQRKLKEKAGKMFAEYKLLGEGGVKKKLDALRTVKKQLENGELKTRTKFTIGAELIPWGESKKRIGLFDPKLKAAMDKVEGAVSLKGALDSQFSKAEADMVYARAFDANATEAQNIEKVQAMIEELENNEKNAIQLYQEQGLMPKRKRTTDLAPEEILIPEADIPKFRAIYNDEIKAGKSPEELFQFLKDLVGGTDEQLNQLIKKFQVENK